MVALPMVALSGLHIFATAAGANLSYYVTGHGPNVLVNVAPGWGVASTVYQNTFTYMEDLFTFLHLEVRGTRASSFPADLGKMSSWDMAEDVEALRLHLGVESFDVMGHSNGGAIAQWYAARFPNRVNNLVLVDAQVLGSGDVAKPATDAILAARPDQDHVRAWRAADTMSLKTDVEYAASLNSYFPLYVAKPERDYATLKNAFTNIPQLKCAQSQISAEGQHTDEVSAISAITARTLVIVGSADFICPVPVSQLISQRITNSVLRIIQDSGHFTFIEQKAAFRGIVSDFYSSC